MLKQFNDILSVSKIASTYLWSNIVTFPQGERYQANLTTFIKCLSLPKEPIGNVLIIQGGVLHMNSASYYIKTACSLLSKSVRIFIFEKIQPVANFEFAHDVADCLTLIKREFSGPICVIGYSMGGILLYTYLSMGYDQADFYIPVCCPLNMGRFREVLSNHSLFKLLQKRACKRYQVDEYEDLMEIAGSSLEKNKEFEKNFIPNLNKTANNWLSKTIYIISSNDPLTSPEDLKLLNKIPITYLIEGGWHCCLESILLSTTLASDFLKANPKILPQDLSTKYGVLNVVKNAIFF